MLNVKTYGERPFRVAVIHGGPGAAGEMAPVARELSSICGILEPLQTADSINDQVAELKRQLTAHAEPPVILMGWSWGAALGFIFTAEHPELVSKLILIGGMPFEDKYASNITATRLGRLSEAEQGALLTLVKNLDDPTTPDKDALMGRLGKIIEKADSYDLLPHNEAPAAYRYDIYQKVWRQAAELRKGGKLLELGRKIRCQVVAIHGDYDPHPAEGVTAPLIPVLRDFRFILLEKCGHCPWRERYACERFYAIIKAEIRPQVEQRPVA